MPDLQKGHPREWAEMKNYKLKGIEDQIFKSLVEYGRGNWIYQDGIFVTSGPHETIMELSVPVKKREPSEYALALCEFLELNRNKQLIGDSCYDVGNVMKLYSLMSKVDGAANFNDGCLTAVKRSIKRLKDTDEGGTRHQAAAAASEDGINNGLVAYVLSGERGDVTVFYGGTSLLMNRRSKNLIVSPHEQRSYRKLNISVEV